MSKESTSARGPVPTDRGGLAGASPRGLGEHRGHETGPAPLDRPDEGLVVLAGAPRLARRARSPSAVAAIIEPKPQLNSRRATRPSSISGGT